MCSMLVNDEQLIFHLSEPVGLKQLPDDADVGLFYLLDEIYFYVFYYFWCSLLVSPDL